jgi:hypothetical protein
MLRKRWNAFRDTLIIVVGAPAITDRSPARIIPYSYENRKNCLNKSSAFSHVMSNSYPFAIQMKKMG